MAAQNGQLQMVTRQLKQNLNITIRAVSEEVHPQVLPDRNTDRQTHISNFMSLSA